MMTKRKQGKLIVIEGTDGSGKTEQFRLLHFALKQKGYPLALLDFPQYKRGSAYFVTRYLGGDYGPWQGIPPELGAMFYALDRFDITSSLQKWLDQGKIVLANRYVASNMGHQGAKITNARERKEFIRWVHEFEYGLLNIPKPDCNIFLKVPPRIATRLILGRGRRRYPVQGKRDIHENILHLRRAFAAYEAAITLYPREFRVVSCMQGGKLRSISDIHQEMLGLVMQYL